jgi:hypothetical protein
MQLLAMLHALLLQKCELMWTLRVAQVVCRRGTLTLRPVLLLLLLLLVVV